MTDEAPIGATRWEVPGGFVPADSTGPEPEMVSHDALSLLNAGEEMATLEITLTYADGHEAGPYPLTVAPRRVRRIRINDLIDPYAPPLGRDYGIVLESDVPVVVQFTRQDTRQAEHATLSTIAYGEAKND
ncbi:sensory rhodopsin transducer [Natrialbaceae archaeon AArc-T1-2]|uniref:sensory rhodopsin transducer n=1 Tax=Natrialbaceae archaeon AArc-T1-2 TaxID=3053904 RepID=UPI00255AA4AC|nr:sensory rhodopsin transducer [Natrialbaceae archaeon AArc-T1-2]WIV66960.1 sensory rhodopsin transducer [Natrialbaceae archaeon AArc-T1-2]